jgi:phage shock protein A
MDSPVKSFWEKPEGKTGMGFIALVVAGGGFLLYKGLPFLIIIAANTLHLMFLVIGIGILGFILTNKQIRMNASMLFKTVMRATTGMIITIDPIAILKNYVKDLYDNLEEMNSQLGELKGVMVKLKRKMEQIKDEVTECMRKAETAKRKSVMEVATLENRKAERRKKSYQKLSNLYKKMEMIYKVLVKMFKNCQLMAEDTKDDVANREDEWKSIKAASGAIKSAMSIVNGDGDQRAVYEQTLEHMADEMGNKLGEMEHFMDMSQTLMQSIDVTNESFDDNMLQNLEEWGKSSDSWLAGDIGLQDIIKESESENDFNPEEAETIDAGAMRSVQQQKINLFNKSA